MDGRSGGILNGLLGPCSYWSSGIGGLTTLCSGAELGRVGDDDGESGGRCMLAIIRKLSAMGVINDDGCAEQWCAELGRSRKICEELFASRR